MLTAPARIDAVQGPTSSGAGRGGSGAGAGAGRGAGAGAGAGAGTGDGAADGAVAGGVADGAAVAGVVVPGAVAAADGMSEGAADAVDEADGGSVREPEDAGSWAGVQALSRVRAPMAAAAESQCGVPGVMGQQYARPAAGQGVRGAASEMVA